MEYPLGQECFFLQVGGSPIHTTVDENGKIVDYVSSLGFDEDYAFQEARRRIQLRGVKKRYWLSHPGGQVLTPIDFLVD
jgi:hypothetical protein